MLPVLSRRARRGALLLASAVVASATSGCGGGGGDAAKTEFSPGAFRAAARSAAVSPFRPGRAVLVKDRSVGAIAAGGRYVVWETSGPEEQPDTALVQRDLSSGKVERLRTGTLPAWGLATTPGWIAYVEDAIPPRLVAIRHDGSDRTVLSDNLIAPIDGRGTLIVWAEGDRTHQRLVVRELETGSEWVAAEMPACVEGRCYRIDKVTLADRGLVFDRGAIGPQPSLIVRRAFGDAKPTSVSLPGDPQPDLARSSAGAFYYQLRRGWMRWDFGQGRPRLTDLPEPVSTGPVPLDYRPGRTLLAVDLPCTSTMVISGGPRFRLFSPKTTPYSPKEFGSLCRQLTAAFWSGDTLLVAWAVIPKLSLGTHEDVGLVGVALGGVTPR